MDARQKFRDLILLLKRDRKSQVFGVVFIILVAWAVTGGPPPRRDIVDESVTLQTGAMGAEEAYKDLITSFGPKLDGLQSATQENAENSKQLRESLSQSEARMAEILKKMIERIADIEQSSARGYGDGDLPVNVEGEDISGLAQDGLEPFGPIDEVKVEVPPPPPPARIAIVGAGDSVRVQLLAGVNAPTDGTPYPVIFQLVDDVVGPDGSALPLGEARLIAAAQGSLTDSRALFRLTSLNIGYPDGSRHIMEVDGWVVGEDGIRGMEGILLDPIGKALAGSMLSGTVEGLGDGIAASNTSYLYNTDGSVRGLVDGDVWDFAMGKGLSKTGERWSDFIDQRMALLVPHVKVLSGRKATAVFSKSVLLPGLMEALGDEEASFASLD